MHTAQSYIKRVIKTSGIFRSDTESDLKFWTGYRVFVRQGIDDYDSIEAWKEENGDKWNDNDHSDYVEFVVRCPIDPYTLRMENTVLPPGGFYEIRHTRLDAIDASFSSFDLGYSGDEITNILEKTHRMKMFDHIGEAITTVVNLYRQQRGLDPLESVYIDIDTFLDTESRTAKIEMERTKLNKQECGGVVEQYL